MAPTISFSCVTDVALAIARSEAARHPGDGAYAMDYQMLANLDRLGSSRPSNRR